MTTKVIDDVMHFVCDFCGKEKRVESLVELPRGWWLVHSAGHSCPGCNPFEEKSNGVFIAVLIILSIAVVIVLLTIVAIARS